MFLIPGTTTIPQITFEAHVSKSILQKGQNRKEIESKYHGENITTLNIILVYIN